MGREGKGELSTNSPSIGPGKGKMRKLISYSNPLALTEK